MEMFRIVLVSLLLQIVFGKSNENLNHACIIRFLQITGKLDESFETRPAPAELCRILLPLIYANQSERLCLRLWETKSVKADCVFELLKKTEFIDLEIKLELYKKALKLSKVEKKKKVHDATSLQREILINSAKLCRSDPTYGGLFDETLGINSSLILLQENFCLLKYVVQHKFVDVPHININPKKIDTKTIECTTFVSRNEGNKEERLVEAFHKKKFSSETIICLLRYYRDCRIFGWNLAKEFLFQLDIPIEARRSEDIRISKKLSDFNKKSSNCLYAFNWSLF